MPLEIFLGNAGRLGNAIFRYLAGIIVSLNVNNDDNNDDDDDEIRGESGLRNSSINKIENNIIVTEKMILDMIHKKKIFIFPLKTRLVLNDYYQHEYLPFRESIFKFIEKFAEKENHLLICDNGFSIPVMDILRRSKVQLKEDKKRYDTVIHIRIGDFLDNPQFPQRIVIETRYYFDLFDNIFEDKMKNKKIALVCENPKTSFEISYVNSIMNYFYEKKADITFESNDLQTDFQIIKNAETVICCMSTFSWTAVFFSDTVKTCYLPDYPVTDFTPWLTMKYPIKNTIHYKFY